VIAGVLASTVAGCANAAPVPNVRPSVAPAAPSSAPGRPSVSARPSAGRSAGPSAGPVTQAPAPGGVTTRAQVFGVGCPTLPDGSAPGSLAAMAGQPVVVAVAANPLLSSLSTALKKAGLVDSLNAASGMTVFAPTDQAFADLRHTLGADRFNELIADQNTLSDLLKYHLLGQRQDRAALLTAGTVVTEEGASLQVTASGPTLQIGDGAGRTATVLCGNIPTANATVFLIDKVLLQQQP
jgi:uncharacterized surface protein with fasciclin (FAS1) repeats